MSIHLENIGKRFNREWIFRGVNHTFESGKSYAILGSNGSGKSTLLQVAAGYARPTEGKVTGKLDGEITSGENLFKEVSLATPYLGLYEEFFLEELLAFHFKFKRIRDTLTLANLPEILKLDHALNRPLKQFSSGMKQRVRLGLALLSDTPYLFLDEPTSNLDATGKKWYQSMIETYGKNRMIVVCSNHQEEEIFFCETRLEVGDYKQKPKSK